MTDIHPTAIIDPAAEIASDVQIGPFCIVYGNVRIDAGSVIGPRCELGVPTLLAEGAPLIIGAGANIRSGSIFYEGSSFGPRLVTGHRVTVREKTSAGENLQIGTLSDIQGHCQIGNFVRFHSNVHIGQKSTIEDFVWIFPYVVLTNDPHPPSNLMIGPTLRRYCAIATGTVIFPGVEVGEGALVGAGSMVSRNVEPHHVVAGNPAIDRGPASKIIRRDGSNESAYPWTTHFRRGYPEEIVRDWSDA